MRLFSSGLNKKYARNRLSSIIPQSGTKDYVCYLLPKASLCDSSKEKVKDAYLKDHKLIRH